jgi:hypothetical protein
LVVLAGCEARPDRCNSDTDCAEVERCVLGSCLPPTAIEPPPPVGGRELPDCAAQLDGSGDAVIVFADHDGDGHGAGPAFCQREAPGLTRLGDDCDDGDPTVFALSTVYADVDGDGFTAGRELACVGAAPIAGRSIRPRAAPVFLLEPEELDDIEGNWGSNGGGFVFYPSRSSITAGAPSRPGTLRVGGFSCAEALLSAEGVEVTLTLDSNDDTEPSPVEVSVAVELGGVASAPEVSTLVPVDARVVVGGPGADFGLALEPELVCDPSFAILVTIVDSQYLAGERFELGLTSVRAFGAEDCDDEDPQAFSPTTLFPDNDGDGFGGEAPISRCRGDEPPIDERVLALDCAPSEPLAFPGQVLRVSRQRDGVGGFDFNCDGQEERLGTVGNATSCTLDPDGVTCHAAGNVLYPSCGQTVVVGVCSSACALQSATFTQACR